LELRLLATRDERGNAEHNGQSQHGDFDDAQRIDRRSGLNAIR